MHFLPHLMFYAKFLLCNEMFDDTRNLVEMRFLEYAKYTVVTDLKKNLVFQLQYKYGDKNITHT